MSLRRERRDRWNPVIEIFRDLLWEQIQKRERKLGDVAEEACVSQATVKRFLDQGSSESSFSVVASIAHACGVSLAAHVGNRKTLRLDPDEVTRPKKSHAPVKKSGDRVRKRRGRK